MSGAPAPDFNIVLCHGADATLVIDSMALVQEAGCPTTLMLAGRSLADAQLLLDAGWVCLGVTPVMCLEIEPSRNPPDLLVRRLTTQGLDRVRSVVVETFALDQALASAAVPDQASSAPGCDVWVLEVDGEIRSCVLSSIVEDALVLWSMATPPRWRRHGYAARLLREVFSRAAPQGVASSFINCSPEGEAFYRSVGFRVIEHWQIRSRPRWALGRS